MKIYAGTSGYSYKEWKGTFFPEDLPDREMLSFYASRLPAVEINNTFYRLPKESVLESWGSQVPADFRFAIKASQRITHMKRLKDAVDETEYLLRVVRNLGSRLGPILFQLPPNLRKDLRRLERFLALLSDGPPATFEFRHPSWMDGDVFECLRSRNIALCVADTDDEPAAQVEGTARWGYLRLRRAAYSDGDLTDWVERLRSRGWEEAFVFFKHEGEGVGPRLASRFLELASEGLGGPEPSGGDSSTGSGAGREP